MATPHTIAVAGKGGVGKTTTCGMIIDYLCKKHQGPVLVVDADANSNLNEVLGVEADISLGQIREEMAQAVDLGDYYMVPCDSRDLNYGKYYEQGKTHISEAGDYTSHNTRRLDLQGMKDMLLNLDYVQNALAGAEQGEGY